MQKGNMWFKFGHEETETYPQSKLKAVRLLDAKGQLQNATVNFKEGEAHFCRTRCSHRRLFAFDNGVLVKITER